jgi:hypothetical protein
VVIVAVVLVIAGVTTAVLVLKGKGAPIAAGTPSAVASTGATPTTGTVTPATPTTATVTLATPATIGHLKKSSDQSIAQHLLGTMAGNGFEQPYAITYADTQHAGRTVIVWGGTGTSFGGLSTNLELNEFFSTANSGLHGETPGARVDVPAGPTGGTAQCEDLHGAGIDQSLCAWIGNGALLGFIITGYPSAEAHAFLPEVLSAIVQAQ